MAVDDATTNSQQTCKETPHKNRIKVNINYTGKTLISYVKNFHEAYEKLEATKSALEKATLAVVMERKVTLVVTTIRNKIQVAIFLLVCCK